MLKPSFAFDPTSRATFLEMVIDGAAATNYVNGVATPAGINRVFFMGQGYHDDNAASHVLHVNVVDPVSVQSFSVPTTNTTAVVQAQRCTVAEPFVCPPGWYPTVTSLDAIPAGKKLYLRMVYLDYLIE